MKSVLMLLLVWAALPSHAAGDAGAGRSVAAALAEAARARQPLLVAFGAPWCYSCYFMATHVLDGPAWQAVQQRAVVLDADTDLPDGAAWMQRLSVKVLPSYVVLRGDGVELGRIIGEQPRERFYATLGRILDGSDTLGSLRRRAAHGSTAAVAAVLAAHHARDDPGGGLAWYGALPAPVRAAAARDAEAVMWRERLRLRVALRRRDRPACIAAAQRVLAGPVGCERPYVLQGLLDCSANQAPGRRRALLSPQQPPLEAFLDSQVLVAEPTCADQRSAVLVAAELAAALDGDAAEGAVFGRAIGFVRERLHDDVATDRTLADNLQMYLARAGRWVEFDALMPQLIAAFPDEYVYPFRFGASLLARGEAGRALPWLEQAAPLSRGANRLAVAEARARALLALRRRADAERVVAEALARNGRAFADAAARLREVLN